MTFHKYLADSKMFEYDRHYKECRQQNKPFIKSKINPAHGNSSITVDLMTCNYVFSKSEQNEIKKLIQDEIEFVNLNCSVNEELIWIDGVSSDHVDFICRSLYDLSQKSHN